jgi:hypothetical protein
MKRIELISSNLKWIVIAVLGVLILMSLKQCSDKDSLKKEIALLAQKEKTAQNNLKVLQDTMEYWQDEAGNYKSEISILTGDKETINSSLSKYKDKYKEVLGERAKGQEMIAYLENQIKFKDQVISGIGAPGSIASLSSDSSIAINIDKQYGEGNYYKINGDVKTKLRDNKIVDGSVDIRPEFGINLALAMSKDKEGIFHITSSTKFPAQVQMSGINMIERELNQSYAGYLGLGIHGGYGLALQQSPTFFPYIGIGISYTPSWLTIKLGKKYK